jgi:hypothetical protein
VDPLVSVEEGVEGELVLDKEKDEEGAGNADGKSDDGNDRGELVSF